MVAALQAPPRARSATGRLGVVGRRGSPCLVPDRIGPFGSFPDRGSAGSCRRRSPSASSPSDAPRARSRLLAAACHSHGTRLGHRADGGACGRCARGFHHQHLRAQPASARRARRRASGRHALVDRGASRAQRRIRVQWSTRSPRRGAPPTCSPVTRSRGRCRDVAGNAGGFARRQRARRQLGRRRLGSVVFWSSTTSRSKSARSSKPLYTDAKRKYAT